LCSPELTQFAPPRNDLHHVQQPGAPAQHPLRQELRRAGSFLLTDSMRCVLSSSSSFCSSHTALGLARCWCEQDRARLADPPLDTVKHVAGALSATLGLSLLGFDMVTNTKTGQHAVIDVNYFPGTPEPPMPPTPSTMIDGPNTHAPCSRACTRLLWDAQLPRTLCQLPPAAPP
jgi:hypothetical protein